MKIEIVVDHSKTPDITAMTVFVDGLSYVIPDPFAHALIEEFALKANQIKILEDENEALEEENRNWEETFNHLTEDLRIACNHTAKFRQFSERAYDIWHGKGGGWSTKFHVLADEIEAYLKGLS